MSITLVEAHWSRIRVLHVLYLLCTEEVLFILKVMKCSTKKMSDFLSVRICFAEQRNLNQTSLVQRCIYKAGACGFTGIIKGCGVHSFTLVSDRSCGPEHTNSLIPNELLTRQLPLFTASDKLTLYMDNC